MSEIKSRLFVSSDDKIEKYENNLVTLSVSGGERFEALEPRRLFPVSDATIYITLLDKEGREVAIIRSINDLSAESKAIIEASLSEYYLVPTITRVISIADKYGTLHWTVETDRGVREFDIRNRTHDIKLQSDGCVRVRDWDDNRYIIPDYRKLDKHSKNQLMAYI